VSVDAGIDEQHSVAADHDDRIALAELALPNQDSLTDLDKHRHSLPDDLDHA
jgi:hypothetical protein